MKRIVLHIDRLVLRGVDHAAAGPLSAALQAQLQILLASGNGADAFLTRHSAPALDVGTVRIAAGTGAGAFGQSLATRIVGGGSR